MGRGWLWSAILAVALGAVVACDGGEEGEGGPGGGGTGGEDDVGGLDLRPNRAPPDEGGVAPVPIVLAHGFNSSGPTGWAPEIVQALEADGHIVRRTNVAPYASTADRAGQLAAQIDTVLADTGAQGVHVLAHSQGGLDARYMIAALGYGDRVRSLTTISTPHRGTAFADAAIGLTADSPSEVYTIMADAFGIAVGPDDLGLQAALFDMAESTTPQFNDAMVDDARVLYQSYAGLTKPFGIGNGNDVAACTAGGAAFDSSYRDVMPSILLPLATIVAHGLQFRSNDGAVTVESAQWGNFRGCIPVDHRSEIKANVDPSHGFDTVQFYRQVVGELAGRPIE